MKATAADLKRRLPGKVADEVRTRYNVKKSDVMPANGTGGSRRAGSVRVTGETVADLALVYRGHRLSPARFAMAPKAPQPAKGLPEKGPGARKHRRLEGAARASIRARRRKIKATITKGRRKVVHSQAFLAHTGGNGADKVKYIPFIRKGKSAYPIKAVKTTSVPQMVRNPNVQSLIEQDIDALIRERLAHNVKRFKKK